MTGPGAPASVAAAEAIRRVTAGETWLLDVRENHEWEAGHIDTAHHIPMGELQARQDEIPADTPILVICHLGQRSWTVTDALVRAEYPAENVEGGMDAWRAAGGFVSRSGR